MTTEYENEYIKIKIHFASVTYENDYLNVDEDILFTLK